MAESRSLQPLDPLERDGRVGAVLVAYASRNGATQGVAERIAGRLAARGRIVDLRAVGEIGDVNDYDAVVVGGPIYDGRWLPVLETFLRRNIGPLAGRPVWLFSVGSFADTHLVMGWAMRRAPRGGGDLCKRIAPRGYRVFGGVIERDQWPLRGRLFLRLLGGRLGDNRDWDRIDGWAAQIARSLRAG